MARVFTWAGSCTAERRSCQVQGVPYQGTIQPSTGVDCRKISTVMSASRPRLQPISLRNSVPSGTVQADRGGGDGQVLQGQHLAHHAGGGVGRGHQHRVKARSAPLRWPAVWPNSELEEVSEPVRATPIQPISGESDGEEAAGGGQGEAQGGGLAGQVHHEGQAQHGGDGDDGPAQLHQGVPVDPQRPGKR